MRYSTVERRAQSRLLSATNDVLEARLALKRNENAPRLTIESAATHYRVRKSTLSDAVLRIEIGITTRQPGPKRTFSTDEEMVVVNMLLWYANRDVPLNRRHLREAFNMYMSTLPVARVSLFQFNKAGPGLQFIRSFENRHADKLSFTRPLRQEGQRWKSGTAESLTNNFTANERLVLDHSIDSSRMWNLDESGGSPGRDETGKTPRKLYLRRNGCGDMQIPEFVRSSRATAMAVVNAAGDTVPPLIVFKGHALPYRQVIVDGAIVTETYSSYLPPRSCIALRDDVVGVNSANFLSWAKIFVEEICPLTAGGRKVLLTYDAYRAHLSLAVLELFHSHGIIVYALPEHTSGKTQPCDVVLFGAWKSNLNDAISGVLKVDNIAQLDMYDYCKILTHAYHKSFTRATIQSSFRRAGLWPFDPSKLLSAPQPLSSDRVGTIVQPNDLMNMMEQKRYDYAHGIVGKTVKISKSGFVDTTNGCVLTSEAALADVRKKAALDGKKREKAAIQRAKRDLDYVRRKEK